MGKLDFTGIEIKVLSSNFAYVLGRWNLAFKDSLKEGLFTVILQRFTEGWRIIHDHTS
jgi:ketosteroid isomerase-like protein